MPRSLITILAPARANAMERGRPRVPAPPVIITVRFLKDWGMAKGVEVALDILEIRR